MMNLFQDKEACIFIVNSMNKIVYINESASVMFPKIHVGETFHEVYQEYTTVSTGSIEWPGEGQCQVITINKLHQSQMNLFSHFLETTQYDELFELNLTTNTYKILCHEDNKYVIPAMEGSLPDMMLDVAQNMIHPDDKERFLEFWELNNLNQWVIDKTPIMRKAHFRKKLINGEYQWVSQIAVSLYQNSSNDLIVMCFIQAIDSVEQLAHNKMDSRGLYNKEDFFKKCEELIYKSEQVYVLVAIDIEHFKLFNEWYGEKAGDEFLNKIADILRFTAHKYGTYGCYVSGDDFIILLPRDLNIIEYFCDKIILEAKGYGDIVFFPALGIYEMTNTLLPLSTMYDYALVALSNVKGNYATRVCYFQEEMILNMKEDYQLLTEILEALKREEFTFYAQPKVNMMTHKIISLEALVRWIHPTKGVLKPKYFVPLLESNGFIAKLDLYIWEKVFKSLSKWLKEGHIPIPISLNVSRIDIFSLDVVKTFIDLSHKYKVDPKWVEIEITESAYAENYDVLADIVEKFHKAGFVVLMDDFGSGYSSLNMLKDVNVDIIKIDMKFLKFEQNMTKKGIGILEAIINMAKIMGLHVIVEGVETKEQQDFLVNIGCIYGQGHYFYEPMPIEKVEHLVANENVIESNILKQSSIQKIHFKEFFHEDFLNESVMNNILGSVAFYNVYDHYIELVKVNEQYCRLTGTSPMNLEEKRKFIIEEVYPEDASKAFEIFAQAKCDIVNGGEGVLRRNREDGEMIWIHLRAFLLKEYDDHCLFYGSITDITEQKKKEIQLEASQRALSAVVQISKHDESFMKLTEENRRFAASIFAQMSPGGMMGGYCEEDYPLYFANYEMVKLLGYDSYEEFEEAIDGKAINTIHPDDREMVARDIGDNYYPGLEYTTTYRMPKKDGTWFWVLDKGKVIQAEDDRLAIVSACTDISEPMMVQEQMARRNESLFKQYQELYFLNNDMPGGYHRCENTDDLDLSYISQEFLDMLGYTRYEMKELFDNKMIYLFHPDDIQRLRAYLKRLANHESPEPKEWRMLAKKGYIWIKGYTKCLQYKGHVFYQGIIVDISETVELKQKMELMKKCMHQDIVLLTFGLETIDYQVLVHGISPSQEFLTLEHESMKDIKESLFDNIHKHIIHDFKYHEYVKINEGIQWLDVKAYLVDQDEDKTRCLCIYSPITLHPLIKEAPQLVETILSRFYCDADIDYVLEHLMDDTSWIGPAQNEYLRGKEAIRKYFEKEKEKMVCCILSEGEFVIDKVALNRCRVMGKYNLKTDPCTQMLVEVKQRCTFELIIENDLLKIQHMHVSNIYEDLEADEYFPEKIGKSNYEYLQRLLKEKMEVIEMVNNNIAGGLKGSHDDDTYSFFYVNERLPQMLGYTYNEFMEMSQGCAVGMVYPPDLPAALQSVDECFAKGLTYSAKYRIRKKNGELMWVMDSGQKFLDENGKYKINSIITDINDLQLLLEEREVERERYRVALGNITDTMFEYDLKKDCFIFFHSQIDLNIEPMKTIEHVKKVVEAGQFIHLDDIALFYEALYQGNNTLYIRSFDKGEWIWVNIQASVVKDENDSPIKIIGIWKDVTNAKNEHDQLVDKAQRDPLTGLFNQSMSEELIGEVMSDNQKGALLLLDVDNFKQVNDTYGHLVGNEVLIQVANILQIIGKQDIVARVGGDEFTWYVHDKRRAISNAETLLKKVENIVIKNTLAMSVSIGIAFMHEGISHYKELFRQADHALYKAKENGKNQYFINQDE